LIWLVLGLGFWVGAHLFKRVLPKQRAALGKAGRPVVAAVIAAGIGLMIFGYRAADDVPLYALPAWTWHLNNVLMFIGLVLLDAGRVKGVIRTKVRHPMLTSVVVWSAAHLLVNGDPASLVLFSGLGAWALLEMAVINRAEGPWQTPAPGSLRNDGKVAAVAVVLYALIAAIHDWLGHPAFVLF